MILLVWKESLVFLTRQYKQDDEFKKKIARDNYNDIKIKTSTCQFLCLSFDNVQFLPASPSPDRRRSGMPTMLVYVSFRLFFIHPLYIIIQHNMQQIDFVCDISLINFYTVFKNKDFTYILLRLCQLHFFILTF